MKQHPKVRFGEIASLVRRPVEVDLDAAYPELGVRSFGKGTFHKLPLQGAQVGSKRLFRIDAGDLILSNVFAWEGAVAVAGADDGGRYGSHRFITCLVDSKRADAKYLVRYLGTPDGLAQLQRASPGGAGRNRTLGLEKLQEIVVPLPPLAEQQAIVTCLDTLADKARQVNDRLDDLEAHAEAIFLSLHNKLAGDRKARLSGLLELAEDAALLESSGIYPQVGVRSFGGGLFAKAALSGAETSYRTFNRLFTDAIVLSQVKGWEGALAQCPPSLAGMFVSPEYRTFRCKAGMASPAYIGRLIKTPWFWSLLQDATRGVGARRERTRPEQFLKVELPMPDIAAQIKIVAILERQSELAERHATIRKANQALVPAMLERIFGRGGVS